MSETLQAPYRFVPLSRFILRPDWGQHTSQDHPFSDGVCGELDIELTTHSPLCAGGRQTPSNGHEPGRVHFYRTPDNRLAIPGSSIKGMLRNVLEIACFGHFNQVQDQRLGVRDISKGDNFYSKAMNRTPVHTGWMKFSNGQWQIIPCDYVRILQADLIDHLQIPRNTWIQQKTAPERYQLLNELRPIQFDIDSESYKADCGKQACNLGQGKQRGFLVVTGQPGPAFDKPKAKKREFVFYNTRPEQALTVGDKALQGFMQIHAHSAEWQYWLPQLGSLEPGVPVFFHKDTQGQIKSIGLSRMYKLAYEHSLHDAIGHTSKEHLDTQRPDLAGLLFGWLDEQEKSGNHNLRGRVQPGSFQLVGDTATQWQQPTVLSNPKPTFYPAYIRQNASGAYRTLMDRNAELSGWKRYPVRDDTPLPELSQEVAKNKKVQVQLETIAAGNTFKGKIRFHNLRIIELGALLWALDFNNHDSSHSLGMGKPFGFGQVRLNVKLEHSRTRPNSPNLKELSDDLRLDTARCAFLHYMNHAWQQATGQADAQWEKSPQVVALLATTRAASYQQENLSYYPEPKQFMKAKQDTLRFLDKPSILSIQLPKNLPSTIREDTAKTLQDFQTEAKDWQAQEELRQQETLRQQQEAADRAERAKTMTPEQIRLEEIERQLQQDPIPKSVPKTLHALHKEALAWPAERQRQLYKIGLKAFEIAKNLGRDKDDFGKQAKKIVRDYKRD